MKFTTSVAAALVAATPLVVAKQSNPFHLVAISSNNTINGTYFFACHEGAAIEGLCVGYKKYKNADTFRLNNTASEPNVGTLNWLLSGSGFSEYEAMTLYSDPSTNVALPLFEPSSDYTYLGFDSSDKMYIPTYVDDTSNPPKSVNGKKLYRWSVCKTFYTGYIYETLAWTLGEDKPQNPTCQDVTVKRVFTS